MHHASIQGEKATPTNPTRNFAYENKKKCFRLDFPFENQVFSLTKAGRKVDQKKERREGLRIEKVKKR